MGMKLISPFASKDKQQEELTKKIIRAQEVEEFASKTNAKLIRAEADFAEALAKSKETWSIHIEEQQKISKDLENEVIALENRKKQALIPIQMYKEEADKIMSSAKDLLKTVKEKEDNVDYLTEKLENRLTEVSDRENIALQEEKRLEVAKQGLQSQQETTREGIKELSRQMILFHEKQQKDEDSLLERKKEVSLAEISFNAKTEKYQRDLQALVIWEKQLTDERNILDREYKRKNSFPI